MDAVNLAGKTALHVACAWGQEQVVEEPPSAGAEASLYMLVQSTKDGHNGSEVLLQYSASIHSADQCAEPRRVSGARPVAQERLNLYGLGRAG